VRPGTAATATTTAVATTVVFADAADSPITGGAELGSVQCADGVAHVLGGAVLHDAGAIAERVRIADIATTGHVILQVLPLSRARKPSHDDTEVCSDEHGEAPVRNEA